MVLLHPCNCLVAVAYYSFYSKQYATRSHICWVLTIKEQIKEFVKDCETANQGRISEEFVGNLAR